MGCSSTCRGYFTRPMAVKKSLVAWLLVCVVAWLTGLVACSVAVWQRGSVALGQCGSLPCWWVSWWFVWLLPDWALSQSGETRVAGGDMNMPFAFCHLLIVACALIIATTLKRVQHVAHTPCAARYLMLF